MNDQTLGNLILAFLVLPLAVVRAHAAQTDYRACAAILHVRPKVNAAAEVQFSEAADNEVRRVKAALNEKILRKPENLREVPVGTLEMFTAEWRKHFGDYYHMSAEEKAYHHVKEEFANLETLQAQLNSTQIDTVTETFQVEGKAAIEDYLSTLQTVFDEQYNKAVTEIYARNFLHIIYHDFTSNTLDSHLQYPFNVVGKLRETLQKAWSDPSSENPEYFPIFVNWVSAAFVRTFDSSASPTREAQTRAFADQIKFMKQLLLPSRFSKRLRVIERLKAEGGLGRNIGFHFITGRMPDSGEPILTVAVAIVRDRTQGSKRPKENLQRQGAATGWSGGLVPVPGT